MPQNENTESSIMTTTKTIQIYFVSDGTGITAEALGHSLLTQFENIRFETHTLPYINTNEKAHEVIEHIKKNAAANPIVFSTLVDEELRELFKAAPFITLDLFNAFIPQLESILSIKSSHKIGKTHSVNTLNYDNYMLRMNAVNYALSNDDGANIHDYNRADVILIGVSRCGKTPTCLYLALQFGIYTANYPLTEDELSLQKLPEFLRSLKSKLFGLSIDPVRLQQIRQERRPNSPYASLPQCQFEVRETETMFRNERIPSINTTTRSIEEIATEIMASCNLKRRLI